MTMNRVWFRRIIRPQFDCPLTEAESTIPDATRIWDHREAGWARGDCGHQPVDRPARQCCMVFDNGAATLIIDQDASVTTVQLMHYPQLN
jgi:hypothetical protein